MSSQANKPIVLIDGSSYLYRAFHALPALMNSKGFPTGAIYGVVNMIKKLQKDYHPECMGIIFDSKGKTFRDDLYKEYKATRKVMPDDLSLQVPILFQIIEAMGLPIFMMDGVEADDIIGTFATKKEIKKSGLLVSTSDKDLAQLVNDKVTLINTMSNTILDPKGVEGKFGIPPEKMIDYLTLVGDTSDNIPGVPLVGPKTAVKWLKEFGSLDNIVKKADSIPGKAGENFRAFIPQLPMTKTLVTIKKDLQLTFDYKDLHIKPANKKLLIELFKEMEFKTWLAELLEETKVNHAVRYATYQLIAQEDKLTTCLQSINEHELTSFVFMLENINDVNTPLIGVAIANESLGACYIPFGHHQTQSAQIQREKVFKSLKPLLENNNIKKIGQNTKLVWELLQRNNIVPQGFLYDAMLESYILDTTANSYAVSDLALKYLGLRTTQYADVAGKGAKQVSFDKVVIDEARVLAAEEAELILKLHDLFWQRITENENLLKIYQNIELPLAIVLARMELHGVLIDPEKLTQQGIELQTRLNELEIKAYELAGEQFNMNSPKQLQDILFGKLKLPVLQKTPKGQPSTADNVLQELALSEFELPKIIIEHRSLSKLISTYTNRLIEQINPKTGRVHTSYNQTGTATGRLSSSDPNLQNIPIRSVEGRRIRKAFIAPPGSKLLRADYSQIELRLMAHLSKDPHLLEAFTKNLDIHRATAAEVWEVPLDKVTTDMRRNAKAINFGLIYGMSAFGLSRQLGIDRKSAEEYIEKYFNRYPNVKAYMEKTRVTAKEQGYVETIWGRRLYIPDIKASQIMRQRAAERMAINAPLQGSAADIIKMAMISIDHWLLVEKLKTKMIMQVHDELVFEVPEDELKQVHVEIEKQMSQVVTLDVPLVVDLALGPNWEDVEGT